MDSDLHLEQAVLHAALVRPQGMQGAGTSRCASRLRPPSASSSFFAHLAGLAADGREPSVAALMAMLGNEELEPGLTARLRVQALSWGGRRAIRGAT